MRITLESRIQHQRAGPSRWHRGVEKNGPQAIGKSRGGWTTKLHLVAADARTALTVALSPGQAHDDARASWPPSGAETRRGCRYSWTGPNEGDETRQLALDPPVVEAAPSYPLALGRQKYRAQRGGAVVPSRLKAFRRVFTRFDKLDALFLGFIHFALIVRGLRTLARPRYD